MSTRTKLELVWVGKDQRPRLEPRILIEDKALSYRAAPPTGPAQGELLDNEAGSSPKPTYDNLLIQGDNLLALKALEQQ
jgi:adenine-specific DNA-methyltransferase